MTTQQAPLPIPELDVEVARAEAFELLTATVADLSSLGRAPTGSQLRLRMHDRTHGGFEFESRREYKV